MRGVFLFSISIQELYISKQYRKVSIERERNPINYNYNKLSIYFEEMEMGLEEKFPAGMRVLAVDDDSTCLLILATMLRKCQYNVTTAKDAIKALQILRENKNEFDLVISDIDMPDMNGFELLQQLGLQMDIPVLLLSAHDDKERVMKGINHGACHYLLKPVQIEELKHIWQHVVRRKLDSRQLQVLKGIQNVDHKPNRKRKYENKEYDKKQNEEYPTTQKKPRVVWLPELHLKFLAAVNQLGLDKAVPKRILELMNVENITRENVASHLQKYRMYLKKRNTVPTPEANMFAAFGSGHSANYSQLVTTQATGYTSYPVAASARDHEPHTHTSIQSVSQIEDVAHGMSIALGFDNGELNKDSTPIATDFSSLNFADASNFHNDLSIAINCDFAGNDLMLDGHFLSAPQQESSEHLSADSSTLDFLTDIIQFQSFYTEHGRISPSINLRDNMAAAAAAHLVINPYELSSLDSVVNTLPDTRTHLWHQEHPINHIVGHNMSRNSNILPGEFPMSSVSKNDLDGPLLGQLDNAKLTDLEAGEANNEIPTPSKI